MIQIENLSKHYGGQVALSDIGISMRKGEIIGLLGVNGAGKSTLMRILAGTMPPDSGHIRFLEKEFLPNSMDLKKQIGYLSEDNPLYEDMYVKEYLGYVSGIYRIDKIEVISVIEKTGLAKESKKKIKELSKGNRQRVGIAQALIHNPPFLILDEATSGLDPNQRESLNNLFKEISTEKVILFSTHILHEVKDICSRFIILDKGKIIADQLVNEIESIENTFHTLTNENNS